MNPDSLRKEREAAMRRAVIDWILDWDNINAAIKKVKENDGAPGIDGMTVDELDQYFLEHGDEIIKLIREGKYEASPIRRTYIPKRDGGQRPLGIATVVDRVIEQMAAQILSKGYEQYFSESSYGYRPNRDCHLAVASALNYLNDGYTWIVDLDISKFFDTVAHDKLISILREKVNDKQTIQLVRSFLKAGVMEKGLVSPPDEFGVPQGGPVSPVLSNIYLDKLDKELENRGLRFCRYADDVVIFVKSEMAANRVMVSITDWLERKLFLRVNATKTKVVRPSQAKFLGFTFWKNGNSWAARPLPDRIKSLKKKIKDVSKRKHAYAKSIKEIFTKVNQTARGWINYYAHGFMKNHMKTVGMWLRHRMRMILLMQWKNPRTIYENLKKIDRKSKTGFGHEDYYKVANSSRGPYAMANGDVVNFIISPKILETPNRKNKRPGLINLLDYYTVRHNEFLGPT